MSHNPNPMDDPFAERDLEADHASMDAALDRPPESQMSPLRRWLARSTPVGMLIALGFVLLIVAVIVGQLTSFLSERAERQDFRAELTCARELTNDVQQAEGRADVAEDQLIIAIAREEGVGEAIEELRLTIVPFKEALARRDEAESLC
jgi:hypothetical protein